MARASHLCHILGNFCLHVVSLLIHLVDSGMELSAQVLAKEHGVGGRGRPGTGPLSQREEGLGAWVSVWS